MIRITNRLMDLVQEIRKFWDVIGSPIIESKILKTGETQIRFVVKLRPKPKEKSDANKN